MTEINISSEAEAREVRGDPAFALGLARAKAMSDENRLLALALTRRRGGLCACELQVALGLTHGTVSHHMAARRDVRPRAGRGRDGCRAWELEDPKDKDPATFRRVRDEIEARALALLWEHGIFPRGR